MSHHMVQRVFVRMQYDPAFASRVLAGEENTLNGIELSSSESRWLATIDPRALRTDPLRRRRTLRTITEEFKITSTLVLGARRSLAFLESYFESHAFHDAVMQRAPIVAAFGHFVEAALEALECPQLPDVLRFEQAMVEARRAADDGTRPRVAAGSAVLRLEGNIFETINTVERYLFEIGLMPQVALSDDAPTLPDLPAVASASPVYVLVRSQGTSFSLTYMDPEDFEFLKNPGASQDANRRDSWVKQGVLLTS